jgi:butyrate kinase
MTAHHILVVFPKETSTQIAMYKNNNLLFLKKIRHKPEELSPFSSVAEQWEFRTNKVYKELIDNDINPEEIGVVIARGGLTKPLRSGVYKVNKRMKDDLMKGVLGEHATNLGGLMTDALLKYLPNAIACIADPVVVDELEDVARVTGHPDFNRKSIFHALNQKNIARVYARSLHKTYEEMNMVIVHMGGGGCSVASHLKGKVVDVNQAFDGEGPFAMTRTGTLPAGDLVRLCFSGKYSQEEIIQMITGKGGLLAHLGTTNVEEIQKMIDNNNEHARFIIYALAYQIAKETAAMWTVLEGNVDCIILSGEIFTMKYLTDQIISRIEKLGKIVVFGSINDMDSLAHNGLMMLNGETDLLEYK